MVFRVTPLCIVATALAAGCQPITVEHKVDPIYITLDINLRVDRELEEFFDFEQEIEADTVEIDTEPDDIEVIEEDAASDDEESEIESAEVEDDGEGRPDGGGR